uniref:Reverse transcriptase domain-containing protein n=1 Tax=Tanacetum cinerariifolium TaxID=118510 RepID=A0A699HU28_TANCI|nr:reverse transcriptase domain-containing protein [Tanacetum cinerariifolium]
MLKFPIEGGIATIRSTILIPTECASVTTSFVIPREERTCPANFTVALHPDFPDQEVVIGGSLSDKGRTELCSVLKKNLDIFAWQPSDMTGVPRSIAEHRLNIREGYSPVRQKKGVRPLNAPGLYKRSWRTCVDFTDLNKACPQDCYPLPEIDWKVESLCGYPFKCFLDAYKGYHQIQLAEADEEKITFHTGQGVYCYTKMPFGLKNAGATYQRLMDKAFESQVGRNIEVYVDDLVVKSYTEAEMMRDIEETFRTLRKADYVMREIHEGSCSMHAGPRSIVAKAVRLGYYWPTMHKDARDMIRKCNDCQIHRSVTRHPQQSLTPITAPWPFYKWGIDIAGPFLEGPGKVKFLIVTMDYFTKWIEAKAVATITGGQDWCDKLNITQRFASVKHPQSNGPVERANRSLGEGIKARLGEGNKNWVEELPYVLWAHRTMIKSSHGDTPFSLTYGTEAVIPTEIEMPTYRNAAVDVVNNDEELRLNLELLEERRERAAVCEARAKSKMMKYYNARVRGVAFKPGNFVYRSNDASYAIAGGKLGPKWEGPYEVTEALGNGAYKLRTTDGTVLPRTWNVANLKRCYL